MKKKRIWLSYDLGINGDYQGLYEWLDSYNAVDCGSYTASFEFEYASDVEKEVITQLKEICKLDNRDRIYLCYFDENRSGVVGNFIYGKRQKAPWFGYSQGVSNNPDLDISNMDINK